MLYSILTVTPLMLGHTPSGWEATAPILPLVVDAAVVIVVRLDAVLARLDAKGGGWPLLLRWMTGLMTLGLNVADSALARDPVGVAVHAVAPLLLIVTAETSLAYRRAITRALARLEDQRRAVEERERQERRECERLAREEREREQAALERREQAAREQARQDREHAERLARERAEWEAARRREEREHEARMERQRLEHAAALARAEHRQAPQRPEAPRGQARQASAQQRPEREAERAAEALERREQAAPAPALPAVHERRNESGGVPEQAPREQSGEPAGQGQVTRERVKMTEAKAREAIRQGAVHGTPVRDLAAQTGWSVGWVCARLSEVRKANGELEGVGA
ncbi:DUF2637 domain-containing protein [Streptomyces hoynatensis]|uniref:DUF2637 domain-containing protein n=2 Tax=Streptomyces hoynatensis TaxID=1141874 RepID=A0A3A9Z4T4_9ACTN|nr:DUF2637 domain-containing protein [Streptomyces hoynatensis]RKN43243.1 DUF2637 domain-containing protein [Streptomyces hoynatensis]